MELQDAINELQGCLDLLQTRLNLLKTIKTGKLYEVDFLMTRKEAAYFLGRSTRHVDRLCQEGKIERTLVDGAIRIRKSSLVSYMGLEIRPVKKTKSSPEKSEFQKLLERHGL